MGASCFGLSELPGLVCLFPSPDCGSFLSLFFQISFQFLALVLLLWYPCNSDTGMFKVVPEVPKPLFIFLNSCFFILFQLNIYIFLILQIIGLSPGFLPFTVGSLYIFLYFTLYTLHSSFMFWLYSIISVSILITGVLNCASDRLAISFCLVVFFLEL